jgi:hypothetical protein
MKTLLQILMIVMLIFINGCNDKKSSSEAVFSITGTVTWKPLEIGFYAIDADDGKNMNRSTCRMNLLLMVSRSV